MKKKLKYLVVAGTIWFLLHVVITAINGVSENYTSAEYAIVFGSKVNQDGTLSRRLKARVDKSFELFSNGKVEKIFVSGGLGKEGHYEGSTMKEYLLSKGVSSAKIMVDDQGNTTRLTAVNFSRMVGRGPSVIVISQFFHVPRCQLALKQVGFKEVGTASPDFYQWRDPISIFREFLAYYKYLLWY